jgi:hypothetical protein
MPRSHTKAVVVTISAGVLASVLVTAGGGCGLIIGADPPAFTCEDGPGACPTNQVCDTSHTPHHCIVSCRMSGCDDGFQCDTSSGLCTADDGGGSDASTDVAPDASTDGSAEDSADGTGEGALDAPTTPDQVGPDADGGPEAGCRGIGCPCASNASCDSMLCADAPTVGSAVFNAAGGQSFCTAPCCTSAECSGTSVCFATGQGGNYCVNPAWIGRTVPTGAALGGAPCMSHAQCRSGWCNTTSTGGACADTCCATSDMVQCQAGTWCQFGAFPGGVAFDKSYVGYCATGGFGGNFSPCTMNSSCQSELCDTTTQYGCLAACRSSANCSGARESCVYLPRSNPPNPPNPPAIVAVCYGAAGMATEGAACTKNSDCASQFCDPSQVCTDVCFANSDCPKAGWRCRPEQVKVGDAGAVVLACGP